MQGNAMEVSQDTFSIKQLGNVSLSGTADAEEMETTSGRNQNVYRSVTPLCHRVGTSFSFFSFQESFMQAGTLREELERMSRFIGLHNNDMRTVCVITTLCNLSVAA